MNSRRLIAPPSDRGSHRTIRRYVQRRKIGRSTSAVGHSRRDRARPDIIECPQLPESGRKFGGPPTVAKCQEPTSPPCSSRLREHFHGGERFSRPRPETVQCELCLLSKLDINKQVVVLL